MKVFWSWQSDLPKDLTTDFVKEALEKALALVSDDLELSPAERPELDHDTKGEAGLVEIVNTIFKKIEAADAFVADVTPVAATDKGKEVPNPNVMIELGHALKTLGAEKIILVANSAYGAKPEDLPFDLRHRRGAIRFNLKPGADKDKRNTIQAKLAEDLAAALRVNLRDALAKKDTGVEFVLHRSRPGDPSTWLNVDERLQHRDFFGHSSQREYEVIGETRSYLRIAAAGWTKLPSRSAVHESRGDNGAPLLLPMGRMSNGDGGLNSLGVVMVALAGQREAIYSATQWFKDSGEVWGFDASCTDGSILGHWRVLKDWETMLRRCLALYDRFGAKPPFRVEAGVGGLDGLQWADELPMNQVAALEPTVSHVRQSRTWNEEARFQFLLDAYNALGEAFGRRAVSLDYVKSALRQVRP